MASTILRKTDPEIALALDQEIDRQRGNIVLIASENYASSPVLEMLGSPLTNKYAEGYPAKRYYGGCQFVDIGEQLAIDRAREIYGAEHANVQPHSGAQANMAAYFALLKPGDTVLGMRLDQGGHLTHGSPVNFSGVLYNFVSYGVDRGSEMLDYDEVERLAKQHAPTLIVAGATAYPRTIDFGRFRAIANEVGASLMVDMAHPAGIIAAGLHPSPVPHADVITSSTHKTLRGPRGGMILTNSKLKGAIDKAVFPRLQGGPLMHVIAAKAVAFGEALNPNFRGYQERVINNAKALAEVLKENGFRVISKGTDTHLVLIDLTSAGVTGQEAETLLESVHITVNKNAIPFDTQPPRVTSGLRLGTPATTTRGFGLEEVRKTGELIARAIKGRNRDQTLREVRSEAEALASSFPLPGIDDSI